MQSRIDKSKHPPPHEAYSWIMARLVRPMNDKSTYLRYSVAAHTSGCLLGLNLESVGIR